MELAAAIALVVAMLGFILYIRPADLRPPDPLSPTAHLEEKKARIYEGLRDLQFEYRVGKLSDDDYQRTKLDLQKELAGVMAEIEKVEPAPALAPAPARKDKSKLVCPHCGARFEKQMKFCGECGKAMAG
jgi:hypothetical protein